MRERSWSGEGGRQEVAFMEEVTDGVTEIEQFIKREVLGATRTSFSLLWREGSALSRFQGLKNSIICRVSISKHHLNPYFSLLRRARGLFGPLEALSTL